MPTKLVVPEALQRDVLPRRSIAGSAVALTLAQAKRFVPKIRQVVRVKGAFGRTTHGAIFDAGNQRTDEPELHALRCAALALVSDPSEDGICTADLETLAAAAALVARADHTLPFLGVVTALRGLEDGVRVLERSSHYTLTAGSGGWTTAVWITTLESLQGGRIDRLLTMRHAVCAAKDAEYTRAVSLAKELRQGLDLGRRARLAYVFPDEPWANEDLAASHSEPSLLPRDSFGFLLSAANDVATVRQEVRRSPHAFAAYALDLVHVLPESEMVALCKEILPSLLTKPKFGPLLKTPPRAVARALACLRTEEAAAVLAPYASHAVLAPIVLGYFRDAPELAGVVSEGKGAAAIGRVVARRESAATSEEREVGEAPPILRERPWRPVKRGRGARENAEVLPEAVAMLGVEEEHVVLPASLPRSSHGHAPTRAMTPAELEAWRAETDEGIRTKTYACADFLLLRGSVPSGYEYLEVPDADCVRAWNTGHTTVRDSPIALVAKHGLAVLPGFVRKDWIRWLGDYDGGEEHLLATMCFVSPRVAPKLARVAARRKKYRRVTQGWLASHARIAALGLVPDAIGPEGEARDDAEAALLFLASASRGQAQVVREAASQYGAAVMRIVDALLARDPLAVGIAPPKRPAFLRMNELPPVALRSNGTLDADAVDALVEMLQLSPSDQEYPGISLVRGVCDPESLGALAVSLVEQWVVGDAPGRHEWMLFAAVFFPSELGERRIAALAREWARKNQEKAKRACVALAALGSDLALMHLTHIAETTRFDALRKHAAGLVLEAAEARGLRLDELGDRTVPDLGLDRDGTVTLSYGARTFVVSLDETLRPVVFETHADAKKAGIQRSLPRPTKSDDPDAVKVARERFELLRDDLDAVADRERRRLERAMVNGRTWPVAEFRARMVEHPLLVHVTRRLVWVVASEGRSRTFRVAEDRSFAGVSDEDLALPETGEVRIAHPAIDLELGEAWLRIFGDYGILQPFEQLARETFAIREDETAATTLERVAGVVLAARKALGSLESRGFRREDPGYVTAFVRAARGVEPRDAALVVRVPMRPGFEIESLSSASEQTTAGATLTDASGKPRVFGELDPVDYSELVRDFETLRGS